MFWEDQPNPMFSASNIHYELADRTRGIDCGGIGAIHLLARQTGLIDAIDRKLHLLKIHKPYHESDHVLNVAYNVLTGGKCLEDLEGRRTNEVYLDALGAQRIPDPTTEGDFCRRFEPSDVAILMDAINEVRLNVWKQQPPEFFEQAIIEADGTIAPTTGECKDGMNIAYNGQWGYHPLLISVANTGEPLFLVNRGGNRPSHEGAGEWMDKAFGLCRRAGFKKILARGDTDFSQTDRLDGWDEQGVQFIFGIDAMANLKQLADNLPETGWKRLVRPPKYAVATQARRRPANVKEEIVVQREFLNVRLLSEDVSEFQYRPTRCQKTYRVVVIRKNLSKEKGEQVLFEEIRYFFYITNVRDDSPEQIVASANDRCNQENLIAQLKNGVRAMSMPVDNLVSNWAYMVMTSLAWTLKAWFALRLPETGRWGQKYRTQKQAVLKMEFRTFLNAFIRIPCQIVRTGRKILYRLLSWNGWQEVFVRCVDVICPMRC